MIMRHLDIGFVLWNSCVGRGRPCRWKCIHRVFVIEAMLVIGWCSFRGSFWVAHGGLCSCSNDNVAIRMQSI